MDNLHQIPCPLLVTDLQGQILASNTDLLEVVGSTEAYWEQQNLNALVTVPSRIFLQTHVFPMLRRSGKVREVYFHLHGSNGQPVPVMVNCSAGKYHGAESYIWIFFVAQERSRFEAELVQARAQAQRMASELAQMHANLATQHASLSQRTLVVEDENRELAQLSHSDPLTGLGNRRALTRAVQRWQEQGSAGAQASLLIVDVDHFKQVNDTFGHDAGDRVLIDLARQLGASARLSDLVVRYGGEEFVVWLPVADHVAAEHIAQRIHTNLLQVSVSKKPVTVSIGAYTLTHTSATDFLKNALHLADRALYSAKKSGRNRTVHFADKRLAC